MAYAELARDPEPARRDTVVIGASAGGVTALRTLLASLPETLPASVLIVQHQSPEGPTHLPQLLQAVTRLAVRVVTQAAPLEPATVYLPPPDHHLVVFDDEALVTREPRENRARPAINPLFRTAAAARSSRTIAVLLTGGLDDGIAGLRAVQRCGGIVVVQDPADAKVPDLPRRALAALTPDYVLPLAQIGPLLVQVCTGHAPPSEVPHEILVEAQLSRPGHESVVALDSVADKTLLSCPSCGGPLWKLGRDEDSIYRCRIGHAVSTRALLEEQTNEVERSLWVAVRTLEERASVLDNLARYEGEHGRTSRREHDAACEAAEHAATLRDFLTGLWSKPQRS